MRALAPALAIVLLASSCGSSSNGGGSALDETCTRDSAALAATRPVRDLGDASRVLRRVIRIESRTLSDLDVAGGHEQLAARVRRARDEAQRSLRAITSSDPQQTMTPVRTGVPNARRSAGEADALVRELCRAEAG